MKTTARRRRRIHLATPAAALLLSILSGCGSAPQLDPNDPTLLERPFTADQIRDAWQPGLCVLLHRWSDDQGESFEQMTVKDADADRASIEISTALADGTPVGAPKLLEATWTELYEHASYPVANSTMDEVTLDTPVGRHDCIRYRVHADGAVTDHIFAKDLAGPPVRVEERRDGELVMTIDQVSRTHQGE